MVSQYEKDWGYEIMFFVNNDTELYRNFMAFNENYILKKKKGKFDRKLAVKGLLNVVRRGITKMNKKGYSVPRMSKEAKNFAAKLLFDELWNDYGLKHVRKANPKSVKTRRMRKKK